MKKIFLMLFMLVVMTMSAMATYTVDYTFNGNTQFTAKAYSCDNNVCSPSTITFYKEKTGTSNKIVFTGSAPSTDPDYYVLYYFPTDKCNLPKTGYRYFGGSGSASKISTLTFAKTAADFCGSNIENAHISATTVPIGTKVTMTADLQSAWNTTNEVADFIPGDLDSYYTSDVNVFFSVNGVQKDHDTLNINWNEWAHVSYDFTPTAPGVYKLRISTNMEDDCHCEKRADGTRSNVKYRELIVTVPPPEAYCGDSICNDGSSKTCEPNGATKDMKCQNEVYTGDLSNGVCRTSGDYACTYCGDGTKQSGAGEQCDDGNNANGDGCSSTCQTEIQPSCGDSLCNDGSSKTCEPNGASKDMKCQNEVYTGDLSNGVCRTSGNYACTYCGDGTKQSGAGEECDDGNNVNDDGCSSTCKNEEDKPYCGDSICNDGQGKTCEPNGSTKDMVCLDNVFTGDLINGSCRTTGNYACTYCGDAILQEGAGEQCDDGNNVDGDGCSSSCKTNEVPEFNAFGLIAALGIFGVFLVKRK